MNEAACRRARTFIAAILVGVSAAASAAQGITTWDELTIRGVAHGEPITVVVRASGGRLTALSTDSVGTRIDVPGPELADVLDPHLNGVQILSQGFPAGGRRAEAQVHPGAKPHTPHHSVKLRFGQPRVFGETAHYHEAVFVFRDGRYDERWIRRVEGKDRWRYETKKPGQTPEPAGIEGHIPIFGQ